MKCFFPVENSHLVDPKQISVVFKNEKQKKKTKKQKQKTKNKTKQMVLTSFYSVFLLPFPILHLFFSIFTPFIFFPCLFIPDTSAKISRSEISGELCPPPPPPACYATAPCSYYVQLKLTGLGSFWHIVLSCDYPAIICINTRVGFSLSDALSLGPDRSWRRV